MRSRYTAFALGDAHHLRDSWFPATRPADLSLDDATEWLGLEVLESESASDGRFGRVRFRARWRDTTSGDEGAVEENSRFVQRVGRWYYVDAL